MVIMMDITEEKKHVIVKKFEKVNQILANSKEGMPSVTLSVGVAFSKSGFTEDLFERADQALYEAKNHGRNRCYIFRKNAKNKSLPGLERDSAGFSIVWYRRTSRCHLSWYKQNEYLYCPSGNPGHIYYGDRLNQEADNYLLRMTMGINAEEFCWNLNPRESFQAPEVIMVYSGEGMGKMTRSYHDFYRNHNALMIQTQWSA